MNWSMLYEERIVLSIGDPASFWNSCDIKIISFVSLPTVKMKTTHLLFALLFVILASCQLFNLQVIRDDFESDTLSVIWTKEKFVPGALEIQSTYARTGEKAAKLVLREGDQIDEEKGTNLERAELREPKKMMSVEGNNYSYAFSLFFPSDFPIVPTRLVIAQWKQNCQSGNCDPNNPVIALRYESGEFRVTLQTGPEKITLYRQTSSILNQWTDFRFSIRFSRNQDGQIKAWMNNREIIDYKGATAYNQSYGYPDPGNFYFKLGLYRDKMPQTMTIYIDDYSKRQIRKF